MNSKYSTRKLAYLGLLTAMVFASNYFRVTMPVSIGGTTSFTLANIICCLCGLVMGPVGGLASGLGSAIYDLTNPLYAAECWITFLTKGSMGLVAGLLAAKLGRGESGQKLYPRFLLSSVCGCVAYYILYFFKTFVTAGLFAEGGASVVLGLTAIVSKVPASVFNAAVAIAVAPPLALILENALSKAGLQPEV